MIVDSYPPRQQQSLTTFVNSSILIFISMIPFFCGILLEEDVALFSVVLAAVASGLYLAISIRHVNEMDLAAFAVLPLFLSAFQNVFLGYFIENLTSFEVQTLVVYNFIYPVIAVLVAVVSSPNVVRDPNFRRLFWLAGGIVAFSAISLAVFGVEPRAFLSSFRNIVSPIVFTALGLLLASKTHFHNFTRGVTLIGTLILAFGFYEYFIDPMVWTSLNLSELWDKKNIGHVINTAGLPRNFYSAEKLGGEQLRRMASTFADPVNFGTVCFLLFSCAWVRGKKVFASFAVLAAMLAISKGAIVGFLVFASIWSFFYLSRLSFIACFGTAIALAIGFVIYSLNHATASMIVHVMGLVSAMTSLPAYPVGRGIGSVGVLGGLFSEASVGTEIVESGLGVVVGQMGLVGLVLYGAFFWMLFQQSKVISDKKEKVFYLTILFAIILNISFNEVALSPNSSAGYFLAMGLLINRYRLVKHASEPEAVPVVSRV